MRKYVTVSVIFLGVMLLVVSNVFVWRWYAQNHLVNFDTLFDIFDNDAPMGDDIPFRSTYPVIEPSIEDLEQMAQEQEAALRQAGYLADTTNWNSYQSEQYGFGFKYPSGWIVIDRDLINQLVV